MANIGQKLVQSLPSNFVTNVATLGPLGFWGRAPGTVGSAVGIIAYTIFFYHLTPAPFFVITGFLIYLSILFCDEAEVRMHKHDPKEVILDEFVAIPLCFIGTGYLMESYPVWLVMVLAFFGFRFFDILKPLGIKKLQNLQGGLGVVVDDLAAALATCACLHLGFYAWEYFV